MCKWKLVRLGVKNKTNKQTKVYVLSGTAIEHNDQKKGLRFLRESP